MLQEALDHLAQDLGHFNLGNYRVGDFGTFVCPESLQQKYRLLPRYEKICFNLETAVGRKKAVYGIGVDGEIKKVEVTSGVMRHFFILPGASKTCADFCDPTAVFRFNFPIRGMLKKAAIGVPWVC